MSRYGFSSVNAKLEADAKRTARATRELSRAAQLAHYADTQRVVSSGACPRCGGELRRNLSLSGWWQCAQLGAVGFRKDADRPSCDWQGFTGE